METQYPKFFEALKNQLHDEDVEKEDFGSGSVVGSTRFGSGGHYQPAPAPPTRAGRSQKRKDKAYTEMCRRAQELVKQGKFKTFEQAFAHLFSSDHPEFQRLVKTYYDLSENTEDSAVEKHEETWGLIKKAIEETSPDLPYDRRLEIVFTENPDLEARWFWHE